MRALVAILGEYEPGYGPQEATSAAIEHAAGALGVDVDIEWMSSTDADVQTLSNLDGVFISPGPLYLDLDRALGAVDHCLRSGTPLTGTCSGFQHTIVALARAGGIVDATHDEYGLPGTAVVTRLDCSLAGTVGEIEIEPGTMAQRLYGATRAREEHRCNYGINPDFSSVIKTMGGVVSGRGEDGTPRIVEIPDHPFFLVTLFLPQLSSRPSDPHPLIDGFVAAAVARAGSAQETQS